MYMQFQAGAGSHGVPCPGGGRFPCCAMHWRFCCGCVHRTTSLHYTWQPTVAASLWLNCCSTASVRSTPVLWWVWFYGLPIG